MLVELESKAENLRDLLEELMDDEEELLELNLSSRPKRGGCCQVAVGSGWLAALALGVCRGQPASVQMCTVLL